MVFEANGMTMAYKVAECQAAGEYPIMSKVRSHRIGEGRQPDFKVEGGVLDGEQAVQSTGIPTEMEGCPKWDGVQRFGGRYPGVVLEPELCKKGLNMGEEEELWQKQR